MCAGDLTIESATESPETWLEGISEDLPHEKFGDQKPAFVDGWGIKHQCRSYDEARDWAFRNHVLNDSGVFFSMGGPWSVSASLVRECFENLENVC